MKLKTVLSLAMVIGLLGSALACSINFSDSKDSDEQDDIEEQVKVQLTVQAVQIEQTAMYQNLAQTQAALEQAAQQNAQQAAAASPDPNATLTPTPIPCNLPKFQSETVPDGTQKDAGQHFAKTWRVKNIGTCTWNSGYRLVFVAGDRMGGPASQPLAHDVRPSETAELVVNLTAPEDDGEYQGTWKIQSNEGEQFGNYWVKILVGSPVSEEAFAVTRVTFNVHSNIDMSCPNAVNIKAEITTNGAGTITYRWIDQADYSHGKKSLSFSEAGSKIVELSPTINTTLNYAYFIYIDDPNHQKFGPAKFHVNCTP